jgi:hypothetical protein
LLTNGKHKMKLSRLTSFLSFESCFKFLSHQLNFYALKLHVMIDYFRHGKLLALRRCRWECLKNFNKYNTVVLISWFSNFKEGDIIIK